MRVEECTGRVEEASAWDAFVLGDPAGGYYLRYGWAQVIERSYRHRPVYLWVREGERVRGVLPLVLFRGPLGSRSLVSLPFLDEGGICAEPGEATRLLWEAAQEMASRNAASLIELRQRDASGLDLEPVGAKVTVLLGLAPSPDVMWKSLDAKVRNQIRKATAGGLSAAWCGIEGLDDFYTVFAANMRDLGSPVHSRRFFARILEEFSESTRLLLVRHGSQTVAGCVCAVFRDTVLVPWASSLRAWRSHCPNNLLYWEVMRSACEKGLRWLDFGRSSVGSGTYRFKTQWGGVPRPLHWESYSPSGQRASVVDAGDARYAWMVRAWRYLPVGVTTMLGPTIRRRVSN
jgi:serine/alanine adding enzyme